LDIVGGWNAADAAGYPDCRSSFITAMAFATSKALDCTVNIISPVIHLLKEGIVREGVILGVPFEHTWSCYTPTWLSTGTWIPCGKCISCKLREKGFKGANVKDPLIGVNNAS
jgi:7-cyano-7-deazaguanine synthase